MMESGMKTSSAKAKGRNLQKKVRELLIEYLKIDPEDIESRSMGAGGEDLIMAKAARNLFPYSIECKNQEALNIAVIKRNHHKPLAVVDLEAFILLNRKEDDTNRR